MSDISLPLKKRRYLYNHLPENEVSQKKTEEVTESDKTTTTVTDENYKDVNTINSEKPEKSPKKNLHERKKNLNLPTLTLDEENGKEEDTDAEAKPEAEEPFGTPRTVAAALSYVERRRQRFLDCPNAENTNMDTPKTSATARWLDKIDQSQYDWNNAPR